MKTQHKYVSYNEKKHLYIFHYVIREGGKIIQQISKTAKTLEDILAIRNEYMRLCGISVELMKEYDYATAPIKEKKIVIPTFKQGFNMWVESEIKDNVKPTTLSGYDMTLKNCIPVIGKMKINLITNKTMQEMFTYWQTKKNFSRGYIKKTKSIVSRFFTYAVKQGFISDNPCKEIFIRRGIDCDRKTRAFTQQEKFKFLLTAKQELGYTWYLLYYVYFQTGCRRGELAAVQWKDIDFKKGYLHITKAISIDSQNGGEYVSTTKNKQSNRIIPLKQNLIDTFKKMSKNALPHDYVFSFGKWKSKSNGSWVSLAKITQNFKRIRDLAELPNDLTLHSTRKTFASELILKGVDLATVKMLGGWNSTAILLEIYAHSNISAMERAIRG